VGGCRKLLNGELHDFYASSRTIRAIKSRKVRWTGHVTRMEDMSNSYSILVGKPWKKRPFGRPRRIWEDKIRLEGLYRVYLTQGRDQWRLL
jgi:hypothetical protein